MGLEVFINSVIALSNFSFFKLDIPSSKVQCYVETRSEGKIELLNKFGFHCEGIQRDDDRDLDVAVYVAING